MASICIALCSLLTTNTHALDINQLTEIENQLSESEKRFDDIILGTEKSIRWFQGKKTQAEFAIIYLHGFSASRQELHPVVDLVADELSANVFYTRLQGHGRSANAMAQSSVEGWKRDVQQAYTIGQQIGKKVLLISTSTGGTLATWLISQNEPPRVHANIMVSPNFGVSSLSAGLLKWPWGLKLAKWINGDSYSFEPNSEFQAKYWTERYPLDAVVPMVKLVDEVTELDKSNVSIPQLIIYSPKDQVIKPEKVLSTAKQFINSDVSLQPFTDSQDPSQHVLAGDALSPSSTNKMVSLISSYIKSIAN